MKLHTFMTTRALAGPEFLGPSWANWRCNARLIDGDAHLLSPDEQDLVLQLTGRTTLPTEPPDELAVGAAGAVVKVGFCALVAAWYAAQDYRDRLAPGEIAVVALAAPTLKQGAVLLGYVRGIFWAPRSCERRLSPRRRTPLSASQRAD